MFCSRLKDWCVFLQWLSWCSSTISMPGFRQRAAAADRSRSPRADTQARRSRLPVQLRNWVLDCAWGKEPAVSALRYANAFVQDHGRMGACVSARGGLERSAAAALCLKPGMLIVELHQRSHCNNTQQSLGIQHNKFIIKRVWIYF